MEKDVGIDIQNRIDEVKKVPKEAETTQSDLHRSSRNLERFINFSAISLFGTVLLASWESFALTFQFALSNGGPASIVYGSILAGLGATVVGLSLAELASIDPTVGAQYRWSANLAPFAPRFWGLVQGWLTTFAWIFTTSGPPSIIATTLTGLAIFNYESYVPERWHISLIMLACIIPPFLCNIWFRKVLNWLEGIAGALHITLFIVSLIVIPVMGKRSSSSFVFETLTYDVSGWSNRGVAFSLGLLTCTFSVSGADSVLHMCDEVKNVRVLVPRSIIIAVTTNSVMMFAFALVLLFHIGNIDLVTNTPTAVPLIEVYYQATGSKRGTTAIVALIVLISYVALFNAMASVSRLIWCFAKDKGLPFHGILSTVHPTLHLPLNALLLDTFIIMLLSLIYIGSATAFNALISLQALALHLSYSIPILFMLLRRLRTSSSAASRSSTRVSAPIPWGPFTLGRFGVPINAFALCYLCYVLTWMPFPQILPVTKDNFNYSGPILGVILLAAVVDWCFSGRRRFGMPVKRYEGREMGI